MKNNVWVQLPNTKVVDVKDQTAPGAIRVMREYEWQKQQAVAAQLGDEGVVPSFGMGSPGDDHYLNIIPKNGATADVIYECRKEAAPRKLLGLITLASRPAVEDAFRKDVSFDEVERIIRAYFDEDAAKLAKLMQTDMPPG